MEINKKMDLIKLLSELNGLIIINKIEGKNYSENLKKMKTVAKALSEEGIGNFDFSSDESFEKSLNEFLSEF